MAMRTSSTSVRPVYEDFEPSTQFTENHEAHILQILLPGFTRDQMRISVMTFTRMLNVSGERPIDDENDKWVRFNQAYPIPQNCEEERLQAHFTEGVLTIKMPKKIVSQLSPQTETQQKSPFTSKKQEPRPGRKAQEDAFQEVRENSMAPKQEKAQEKMAQKYAPTQVEEPRLKKAQERSPKKYTPRMEGPKPENAHEHIPQGSIPSKLEEEANEEEIPFKFRIRRGKEDLIQKLEDDERGLKALLPPEPTKKSRPEKGQNETDPIIKSQRRLVDEKPPVGLSETERRDALGVAPKKPKDEKPAEKGGGEIEKERETKKGEEGKLQGKPEKMFQEKEIRTRTRNAEKEKETLFRKEGIVSTIGKGIREVSASTSEVVTKISEGKWKEEEKPTLVNMGVAILVIAALGVYVSYTMA